MTNFSVGGLCGLFRDGAGTEPPQPFSRQSGQASLSAFDQIAKECRKYGLFLCIATQMPKDIPLGTLSQMGTFIVHRLINYSDKEAIKQACSSADADMLAFLPMLGAGEAIISGVDFPMPLSVIVEAPRIPPNSQTPTFKDIITYKTTSGTVLSSSF